MLVNLRIISPTLGVKKTKTKNVWLLRLVMNPIGRNRLHFVHLGVSKNNGTPKLSILIGFSITNHPFWGTPMFGNTHLLFFLLKNLSKSRVGWTAMRALLIVLRRLQVLCSRKGRWLGEKDTAEHPGKRRTAGAWSLKHDGYWFRGFSFQRFFQGSLLSLLVFGGVYVSMYLELF